MKQKTYTSWIIFVIIVAAIGYFGYQIVQKEIKKRVVAQALENGAEAVVARLESEQNQMVEDLGIIFGQIEELESSGS